MDERLQRIYDETPLDGPRSKLDPYRELILLWRRQGRTYRRICCLLADKCDMTVSYLALYNFVQRHSRPRKQEATTMPASANDGDNVNPPIEHRRTPEEMEAMRVAMRAAYEKPLYPIEERKPKFVYDPTKRIRNTNIEGKSENNVHRSQTADSDHTD